MTGCYLDASALVKLGTEERESLALRDWLRSRAPLLTNRVSTIEVSRAILRKDERDVAAGRRAMADALTTVAIVELDAELANRAADLSPPTLRALDAIHLATALALADEVSTLVTYDARLADAARAAGLEVVAPG